MQGILEFGRLHFDTIVTVSITILGFIVTYFMNKKSVQDELKKDKVMHTTELMETLPYDSQYGLPVARIVSYLMV